MTSSRPASLWSCPVCGGNDAMEIAPYNGYAMVRCEDCRLVLTRKRSFDPADYHAVYQNLSVGRTVTAYREMIDAAERTARGEYGFRQLWWFKRMTMRRIERDAPGRRLLDVGCGPGTFLLVAKSRGWQVAGVEPAAEAAQYAQKFGIDVFNGVLEDSRAALGAGPWNAITSFEVLEHMADPLAALSEMRVRLAPGGIAALTVPNLDDSYCLRQPIPSAMPPIHVNFFNRRSFGRACERAGMRVERFVSLPIPTSSVRNTVGVRGFLVRVPLLLAQAAVGRADGTTLIAFARPL